jgi:hypothetical protein
LRAVASLRFTLGNHGDFDRKAIGECAIEDASAEVISIRPIDEQV